MSVETNNTDPAVLNDPRWVKLNAGELTCSCGEKHAGMFPINILHPIGWPGSKDYEPDAALRMEGDFLSANYCVREGKYFSMRVRLPLQIKGSGAWAFVFTCWASLNRVDFEGYLAAVGSGKLNSKARAPARLVNRLSGFENTFSLMGTAFQQEDGGAPLLLLHGPQPDNSADHLILKEQREGITLDRMFELYAAYGHEMRPKSS
jgi:hypothetical protein